MLQITSSGFSTWKFVKKADRSPALKASLPEITTLTVSPSVPSNLALKANLLEVEDHLGYVFNNALDGRELVVHALNAYAGERESLEGNSAEHGEARYPTVRPKPGSRGRNSN